MNRYCIILLAAGCSSRYGSPKLLAPIGESPLVAWSARAALASGARLFIVTGSYADQVNAALEDIGAELIHNSEWQEGMGTSIGVAFQHLLNTTPEDFDAAIVCPADMPLIGPEQFQRLMDAHQQSPQGIVVSDSGHAQGPPCLFSRRYFEELSQLRGAEGARSVIKQHALAIVRVAMPEAAVDIDTPDDYAKLQESSRP